MTPDELQDLYSHLRYHLRGPTGHWLGDQWWLWEEWRVYYAPWMPGLLDAYEAGSTDPLVLALLTVVHQVATQQEQWWTADLAYALIMRDEEIRGLVTKIDEAPLVWAVAAKGLAQVWDGPIADLIITADEIVAK